MNSTIKLIRRFCSILIISIALGILLNLIFLLAITWNQGKDSSGWQQAEEIAAALNITEEGSYVLSEEGEKVLERAGAWGILVENDTGNVIWSSPNLPQDIPTHYTLEKYPGQSGDISGIILLQWLPKGMIFFSWAFPKTGILN